MALLFKEEILLMVMEQVDSQFMVDHSMIKALQGNILVLDYCQWLIVEEILILVNFLLH